MNASSALNDENQALLPQNRNNTAINLNRDNSTGRFKINIPSLLLALVVITASLGFSSALYFHMASEEKSLRVQLNDLTLSIQTLKNNIVEDENKQNIIDTQLQNQLAETLNELTVLNHTANEQFGIISSELVELSKHSNVEVLTQLEDTKQAINNDLSNVKSNVNIQLDKLSRNVTSIIDASKVEFKATEAKVQTQLENTMIKMKSVVTDATSKILAVQTDVTSQLSAMDVSLDQTKRELNAAVSDAQEAIHAEVQGVKDNINQYVIITNKQFAAENDFVKYQLAGTFTLLACLISLWHVTSHMRHYAKPDVQRRIMAVLWMVIDRYYYLFALLDLTAHICMCVC